MMLHLLRPFWLLLLVPAAFCLWRLWQQESKHSPWEKICDVALLPYLLEKRQVTQRRFNIIWLALALLSAVIALAGPAWREVSTPVYRSLGANLIVFDLSPQMQASDPSPNRFVRAKYKLLDLLKVPLDLSVGLVVFSGEAYSVAPVTRDAQTLIDLASTLNLSDMPVTGDNLAAGLTLAESLLTQAQANPAYLTLILGSPPNDTALTLLRKLASRFEIAVLAMSPDLDASLAPLVQSHAITLVPFTQSHQDIQTLTQHLIQRQKVQSHLSEGEAHHWADEGRWFVLIFVLLLLLAFRRGALS